MGEHCGMQPITHTRGTFCDDKVVIENQHLGGSEEGPQEIECLEAERKLKCSSCGVINATDPHFFSACVMAAGGMGCRMKIYNGCHGRKENYGANNTSLCLPKCDFLRYGAIANMGSSQRIAGQMHGWSR